MNCLKQLSIILFLLQFITGYSIAQKKEENKWVLGAGFLLSREKVLDKKFSAAPGRGTTSGARVLLSYTNSRARKELNAIFTKGDLFFMKNPASGLKQLYFEADYTHLFSVHHRAASPFTYMTGGSVSLGYVERKFMNFINSDISFEGVASLSATLEIAYRFKGFILLNRVKLPLLSSLQQPVFGMDGLRDHPYQEGFKIGSFADGNKIVSFSSFFRATDRLSLEKDFMLRHKLSIAYTYDYYSILTNREVRAENHRFEIFYAYKL